MKEISFEEFAKSFNPFLIEKEGAIALASDGKEVNGLTIGWAGFGVLWGKNCATVYVHKTRYSKHIFDNAGYFSICYLKDEDNNQIKYFGTVSGRDENKIEKCGLTLNGKDNAPYFEESKVVIICRVMGKSDFNVNSVDSGVLQWYKRDGVHTQYYGEIVKVLVAEDK